MAYAFFHHMPSPTHTAYPFFVKREAVKTWKKPWRREAWSV